MTQICPTCGNNNEADQTSWKSCCLLSFKFGGKRNMSQENGTTRVNSKGVAFEFQQGVIPPEASNERETPTMALRQAMQSCAVGDTFCITGHDRSGMKGLQTNVPTMSWLMDRAGCYTTRMIVNSDRSVSLYVTRKA